MNVHRWRKLEGSDPATFELIQKVQALQKRLIEKTEDIGIHVPTININLQCKMTLHIILY